MSTPVSVSSLQGLFRPGVRGGYDIDGNGVLDRPELAKASLSLMGNENPNAQNAGRLLATFVQGGKNGQGLLPDYNGDNALSLGELNRFAGPSGVIGPQNFQQTFGDQYQAGGSNINIPGLQDIASQNSPKFRSTNPATFTNAVGSLHAGINPTLLGQLYRILSWLQPNFGGGGQY
jgi:hypothetical protein